MTPIKWIIAQRGLNPTARLLLFYYCARANGELVCFPSYGRTAQDCELTRRGVIKGTLQLCASGQISIVSSPAERSAILAKAGAKDNCRANIYRINAANNATDSEHSSPSSQVGEHSSPLARTEAELLALCVPIESEHSSPSEGSDGEQDAPSMVNQMHGDGEQDAPRLVNTVHPNLKEELTTEPREGAPLARTLSGAPGAPREQEAGTEPAPEPTATTGGTPAEAPPKAPVLGGGASSLPQGLRRPGAPPDPFADWLDQGAPPDRAIALAIPRPKPIYAPLEAIKAARQSLAQRHAELVSS